MNKLIFRSIFFLLLTGAIITPISKVASVKANQFSTEITNSEPLTYCQTVLPSIVNFKWKGFLNITSNLYPIKKGKAEFYTSSLPLKGSYYTTISVKLQRYKSGSWKTIKTGTIKGKGSQLFSDHYYVSKGYKYRCTSSLKVYSSKGGKLINQESITTTTRKY